MFSCGPGDGPDLKELLPAEAAGWKPTSQDQQYTAETIFDYIDGAGELYRAYGFEKLLGRRYGWEGGPDIIADLFDMGSSRNAFGVFTHDRLGEEVGIGQESVYKNGLLSFWKDRYYVSLYAERETEDSKRAVLALGRFISSKIGKKGALPGPVSWLPPGGLDPRSVRYFYNHHVLNMHFFIADGNILNLGRECEGVLGAYERVAGVSHLLAVGYPDQDKARAALQDFKKAYMPEAADRDVVQTENKKWTAVGKQQAVLAIHFDALTETEAVELTRKCLERSVQH